MRTAALVVGALLLAAGVPALATPPVCHVIPDERGDERLVLPEPEGSLVPGVPGDDLLSADLASDGRTLTAVLRLASLPTSDPAAPFGRQYSVTFHVGLSGPIWVLAARTSPLGTTYSYGRVGDGLPLVPQTVVIGKGRGTVDLRRREVRIHAPASAFRLHRGSRLVRLKAAVARVVGADLGVPLSAAGIVVPTSTTSAFDAAQGDHYVVGTPSCVRVGV